MLSVETEYRVISIRKIKRAKKCYSYYNGKIKCGDSYFRGFAVKKGIPFEFFFTDPKIYRDSKIKISILNREFISYWERKGEVK